MTRAASMYWLFFSESTEPRTTRAVPGTMRMPIVKIIWMIPVRDGHDYERESAPHHHSRVDEALNEGIETIPPKKPVTRPMTVPAPIPTATAPKPMSTDTRAP